ncbi:PfkB family carbohydrate kinase [Coraliomargarita sp. SDUM461004]|uniref:PfkB family carbohydrate kinase n=1 Tax=Thalassobacterium sedimentorum TaxID=3041258 RepID=A0ABU1AMZ4_9BACT|nr:PfkB family carbohydrate kinase [Coraliomargarita sp. SDUM461004]MDQ8194978.1 PfkB family carbohydrate kinase [Coraliomargarita sp. SDUM461004]
MEYKTQTLQELADKSSLAATKNALVGIDGFVDVIVHPVDQRSGPGDQFQAIATITDFAKRIGSAAGKSANIEMAPIVEKLGGNGPIMANAQFAHGLNVHYLGALGKPAIHQVFSDFAKKTKAISIADPGVTHAAEFNDGKIMFGTMASLDEITYERLCELPGEDKLIEVFDQSDLIAMVNWTMIPFLTDVFNSFLKKVLPSCSKNRERTFFFDLADPEKRSEADLLEVLDVFSKFEAFGKVILGLNLREAEQVDALLGFAPLNNTPENLQSMAARIREKLQLNTVVIHPVADAACATPEGTAYAAGPYCEKPKITTGAGDHFNSGFVTARLIGLTPEAALTVAVATSGFYVRTAVSPTLSDLSDFIATW